MLSSMISEYWASPISLSSSRNMHGTITLFINAMHFVRCSFMLVSNVDPNHSPKWSTFEIAVWQAIWVAILSSFVCWLSSCFDTVTLKSVNLTEDRDAAFFLCLVVVACCTRSAWCVWISHSNSTTPLIHSFSPFSFSQSLLYFFLYFAHFNILQ